MTNLIGQSLGRYHILEQLGEGGMATVYKAYDTRLERDVAIKIIRRGAFPPDQLEHMLKRFEREAKSLAKLSHPNIVKVLDFGEHEDAPYLVMEYFPSGTLKQRLGIPIPWQDAVRLLLPVAQALEYAHEHNIIHRDIKPANILLTEKGQPMLTDFGIAKILETNETATLTGTGVGVGTPEYMAPEQWTGQTTSQSDIYSLGVVLYEMVTGRKPYTADTPAAILLKQANDPLPRPSQFVRDLSDRNEKILLKALAKHPEDRYQSVDEFSDALMGKIPVSAKTRTITDFIQTIPDLPAQNEHTISRFFPKYLWIGLGVLGIALFCGLFIWALGNGREKLIPIATPITTVISTATLTPIAGFTPFATLTPIDTSGPDFTSTPALDDGSSQISSEDGMIMLYIPAGEFSMGNSTGEGDEKPVHSVYLDSFWIDQTEVTTGMYAKCVQEGRCNQPISIRSANRISYYGNPSFADYPVIYVSWNDAKNYCNWAGRRLPTEAEWEKAAGWDADNNEKRIYPWGSVANCSYANFWSSGGQCERDTTEVKNYPLGASYYSALDMAGNVWEWVSDWYDAYPGNTLSDSHFGMIYHVLRGGSWNNRVSNINGVRTAYRFYLEPAGADSDIGFRCARDASP